MYPRLLTPLLGLIASVAGDPLSSDQYYPIRNPRAQHLPASYIDSFNLGPPPQPLIYRRLVPRNTVSDQEATPTAYTPTFTTAYRSDGQLLSQYGQPQSRQLQPEYGQSKSGPGMPYAFSYAVNDPASKNFHSRKEESDGQLTEGEYRILMPDGRVQIVK